MEHPKDVGDRTTLAVMLALHESGYTVSVPFGENVRYDLIVDDEERLVRVQCKTGRLRAGGVVFRPSSSYAHHKTPVRTRRPYTGQIDYFGVYCTETGDVYLVPIGDVSTTWMATLRVDPCRNGQRLRVRSAAEYLVANVARPTVLRPALRASSGARGSSA